MTELFDEQEQKKSIEKFQFNILKPFVKKNLRILVTGRAKTGKTRFCLTAEEPILFLDTEFGIGLLANELGEKKVYYQEIVKFVEGEIDSIESLNYLEFCIQQARNLNPRTIVIDSITSIWQWLQDWLRYEIAEKKGSTYKSGASTLNRFNEIPTDRRDWGKANHRHHSLLMNLMSFDANIILTAQNHPIYDAQGNQTNSDKPSMQKNTPFLLDTVIELKKEIRTGKPLFKGIIIDSRYYGDIVTGQTIDAPTFSKLKEVILHEKN